MFTTPCVICGLAPSVHLHADHAWTESARLVLSPWLARLLVFCRVLVWRT